MRGYSGRGPSADTFCVGRRKLPRPTAVRSFRDLLVAVVVHDLIVGIHYIGIGVRAAGLCSTGETGATLRAAGLGAGLIIELFADGIKGLAQFLGCLLYTSPSPRDTR